LTKATDPPSLHFCPDPGHWGTEPADAQLETAPMSREGARIWRDTLASLGISPRESQIIESIVAFADDEASIAARLGIPLSTVRRHLRRLYRKVGVANRWQLLAKLLLAYIATRRTYVLRMLAER
jgi:DNA-binding NarL/FixJ family response regulator